MNIASVGPTASLSRFPAPAAAAPSQCWAALRHSPRRGTSLKRPSLRLLKRYTAFFSRKDRVKYERNSANRFKNYISSYWDSNLRRNSILQNTEMTSKRIVSAIFTVWGVTAPKQWNSSGQRAVRRAEVKESRGHRPSLRTGWVCWPLCRVLTMAAIYGLSILKILRLEGWGSLLSG